MSDPGPERRPRPDPAGTPGPGGSTVQRRGAACAVRGIVKRYGAAVALQDVSLDVAAGEIHALVGENGAGKSTLGKIIAGAVAPDAGEILVDGEPVSYRSPRDAIRYGIGIIEQEFALAPDLSVLDNVFLGVELGSRGLVDRGQQRERFAELAERIGFRPRPSATVRTLRTADQQKVEILRQLVRDTRLIVMDEPTAALTRDEADRLLEITRELRDDGVTVIYVSHILGDALACATRSPCSRTGAVKTTPASEETSDTLVTAMLGRSLDVAFPTPRRRRPTRRWSSRCAGSAGRRPSTTSPSRCAPGRSSGSPAWWAAAARRSHARSSGPILRGHGRARRAGADRALPAVEHPARHGAAPREPQGPGPRHGPAR